MAMLVVLETLSPDERAVFVLREVFGFSHDEIASTIGKSAAAVRQMAHRARDHVQSRRKRFDPVDPKVSSEITARFFAAASTGDVDGLLAMLTDDVVWTADSDGKATAARRPVRGAERVARVIIGLLRVAGEAGRIEPAMYNNSPAFRLYLGDNFEGVVMIELTEGRISHFYVMRNPDKLVGVDRQRQISR
jgi:RNA polymerase sigma-70 factor (ECF subfamily)